MSGESVFLLLAYLVCAAMFVRAAVFKTEWWPMRALYGLLALFSFLLAVGTGRELVFAFRLKAKAPPATVRVAVERECELTMVDTPCANVVNVALHNFVPQDVADWILGEGFRCVSWEHVYTTKPADIFIENGDALDVLQYLRTLEYSRNVLPVPPVTMLPPPATVREAVEQQCAVTLIDEARCVNLTIAESAGDDTNRFINWAVVGSELGCAVPVEWLNSETTPLISLSAETVDVLDILQYLLATNLPAVRSF